MDMEKVMSWLEGLTEPDWRECYSDSEVQETARQALDLIDELLKEQNGLILALEQANAIINYLNDEKEKAIRDINLYIADAENDAKTQPRTGKVYSVGLKYGLIIAKEIMQGKRNHG